LLLVDGKRQANVREDISEGCKAFGGSSHGVTWPETRNDQGDIVDVNEDADAWIASGPPTDVGGGVEGSGEGTETRVRRMVMG
jgi:hypothetical protein